MDALDYLNQVRTMSRDLAVKKEKYAALRGMSDTLKTEDDIVEYLDLEVEIKNDAARLADLKEEIAQLIRKVRKPEYRTLLELRYLSMWKWEKIAVMMNYSPKHVYWVHRGALAAFEKVFQKGKSSYLPRQKFVPDRT